MNNIPKICLDAGHYGSAYNQSTEVPSYYESEMAWKLHLYLKEALEAWGFLVVTTRENQNDNPAVYTRGTLAQGCDLFLSLHSNACGTESVDYPIVYVPYDKKNQSETLGCTLAEGIASLMATMQGGKTGTRTSADGVEYYGVMRGARAVDCPLYFIVEHSFHTNKKASLWLLEQENLKKLAQMEADILANHFGLTNPLPQEDTSDYTQIMGQAEVSSAQMKAYLLGVNPNAQDYLPLVDYFLAEGKVEGVRGDIAFAQSCLETGNFVFGGDVLPEQNNFCGLGAVGNGAPGCAFDTMEEGARAQIQHLQAYASNASLYQVCIDPRYQYVTRCSAEYVEWLGIQENPQGLGWASGANYGEKVLTILQKMKETSEMEETTLPEEATEVIPAWMKSAVDWMVENQLMTGDEQGLLHVNNPLTRGEFSVILYQFYNKML